MGKPIRVLNVLGGLNVGGAESRVMDIYRSIDKNKIQFDFVIHTNDECYFSEEVRSMGGKIFNFPRFNGANYLDYKKRWETFFKEHPEYKIIHGHQTSTGFIYLRVAKKNGVPVRIAHSRSSNKDNIIKKYTSKLSRFYATHLLAVSSLAGISEFGKKRFKKGEVKVIPNAIDAKKYSFDLEVRKLKRKELNIEDAFAICHIGRFHPVKNHSFIIQIFKHVRNKYNNAKLVLIGEGSLRKEIESQVLKENLRNDVLFLGLRSDVPDLLQAMDVLVFPSFYEGFPGVVLEAQAAGLPCLISDTITKEVVITDIVECLSLNERPDVWAEKLLNFKNVKRKDYSSEIILKGYDIKSISKWYEKFYLSFVSTF